MHANTPNLSGTRDPKSVVYGPATAFPSRPIEGSLANETQFFSIANLHSTKASLIAVTQAGSGSLTYEEDEFCYLTSGWIKMTVHQGDQFTLRTGDVVFIPKGTTVDFEYSDDFANVIVLMASGP